MKQKNIIELKKRFWAKVIKTPSCWVWTGSNTRGRGRFNVWGTNMVASRVVFEFTFGKFNKKFYVLHRCDNPSCIRPSHLFLGDQMANIKDMKAKGRERKAYGKRHWNYRHGKYLRKKYAAH